MAEWIKDCNYASLEEAIAGKRIPEHIRETLCLVSVPYISFDNKMHEGQLVVHKDLAREVTWLFGRLFAFCFPIERVVPVIEYGWSDKASMEANNSSAFNIRRIPGTDRFSQHSYGWAIDINPRQNPCLDYRIGTIEPKGCPYERSAPGTLTKESSAVILFKNNGWVWGGDWNSLHDYMHFEKRLDGGVS